MSPRSSALRHLGGQQRVGGVVDGGELERRGPPGRLDAGGPHLGGVAGREGPAGGDEAGGPRRGEDQPGGDLDGGDGPVGRRLGVLRRQPRRGGVEDTVERERERPGHGHDDDAVTGRDVVDPGGRRHGRLAVEGLLGGVLGPEGEPHERLGPRRRHVAVAVHHCVEQLDDDVELVRPPHQPPRHGRGADDPRRRRRQAGRAASAYVEHRISSRSGTAPSVRGRPLTARERGPTPGGGVRVGRRGSPGRRRGSRSPSGWRSGRRCAGGGTWRRAGPRPAGRRGRRSRGRRARRAPGT